MQRLKQASVPVQNVVISSIHLERDVLVDFYLPPVKTDKISVSLLIINDGQDLPKFHFDRMLGDLYDHSAIEPVLCVGIHCGAERKMEYGTASLLDYKGRGAKARLHQQFVLHELLPHIFHKWGNSFAEKTYAGFSLGGLSAIDTVWHHPEYFSKAAVFSGSLWWRSKDLHHGYNEKTDRIMHKLIREGDYKPGLKFYFTTGSLDEKMDRNNNGIIDSIDDTLGLIDELEKKGYKNGTDICYINYDDGKHDVKTWGRAMPAFLKWGWGRDSDQRAW
ncbi:MAG TPA: alpha/beta hydrolase-fold protein [Chitinophagaceae bacterium]